MTDQLPKGEIELGSTGCSRTVSDSCMSPNAACQLNGYCTCNSGYYDDNGNQAGGTCTRKIELGSYGCSTTVSDSCKTPNAACQSDRYCRCNNGYYDDNGSQGGGTCRQKIELGSTGCSTTVTNSCKSPYATCQSHGGSCKCNNGYYDDNGSWAVGGTCTRKIELGSTGCSTTVSDSCKSLYATCQSNGGSCKCNDGYYDDNGSRAGGTCRQKIELGSTGCSTTATDSCKSPHATCQSSGGNCRCNSGYYDDNGSGAGGTCTRRKDLGVQCSNISNECADTNAACLDNKCTCGSYYYDDSGFNPGGSCESVSNLQVSNVVFSSIQIDKITVTWTIPENYKQYINRFQMTWRPTYDNTVNTESADLASNSTSYTMTRGVDPGRAYTVTIISINDQTQQGSSRITTVVTFQAASKII
ncbi:multiple epidermal growth factor-like domains protein 10 [Ruditapes philippinarum]|uniref:multiple epidermal growth factor-like domains protein 10 n=1 Tax=Ruditapes philippinarum TaxID=129788 RepID=UPI00295BB4FA|nr:multiple epidermal growth factor-like domains protein 10 [Ruditapes philippinarum]